jgi:hypothetical protein
MRQKYDMPSNYYFGGGTANSFVTPLAGIILFIAIILIFGLHRKSVIVPFLVAGVLLPFDITIVVFGFHLQALRLVLLAGWLRIVLRRDVRVPRMNMLDKAFLFWAISNAIFFCLLWMAVGAVDNRIGFLWTTLGSYFLVRSLIRDKGDVVRAIRVLAILMIIIAPVVLVERFTQHNWFSLVGSPLISTTRDGVVRAEGPFAHPVIAGTVGGMVLPLFIGLWWQGKKHRMLLGLAVLSSIGIVTASRSSTPIMTTAAGLFALLLWPLRAKMRSCRWALVSLLAVAQLAMKSPIWFLLSRAGSIFGGSGYHRATLIDTFVRHFGEWWLIGTRDNATWGYDMWDVDNAYVAAGVGGGLITFIAFVAILVYAYKKVGKSRKLTGLSRNNEHLVWAIGACLFANTIGFIGIVYFDQSVIVWYSLLAMVSAAAVFNSPEKNVPAVKLKTVAAQAARNGDFVPSTTSLHVTPYRS